MKAWLSLILAVLLIPLASPARAFCGFYVAQANTRLYNSASRVVLARKDGKTT
ncbi:MAG: hypothetical protein RL367_476, partial [Pseudomonadota bacterium]